MAAQPLPTSLHWHWSRFDDLGASGIYQVMAIRQRVFILEQGPFLDADGVDPRCWHLLGRDDRGSLLAYLRIVDPGVKYREPSMGRVVSDATVRGTGVGRLLVAEGLAGCERLWPGQGNRISAQARLKRFYAEFGYAPVGDEYIEDDIAHVEMLRPSKERA